MTRSRICVRHLACRPSPILQGPGLGRAPTKARQGGEGRPANPPARRAPQAQSCALWPFLRSVSSFWPWGALRPRGFRGEERKIPVNHSRQDGREEKQGREHGLPTRGASGSSQPPAQLNRRPGCQHTWDNPSRNALKAPAPPLGGAGRQGAGPCGKKLELSSCLPLNGTAPAGSSHPRGSRGRAAAPRAEPGG